MADWDRSSTSDNASVVSVDPTRVVALETTNEETSKLEFSEDEEMLIAKMFNLVGERWSLIAGRIPGRSADEIEKFWKSRIYSKNQCENLAEILVKEKDEAESIGLKEECGHSMDEILVAQKREEKRPISILQPSEPGPQQQLGPIVISPQKVNPAQDQTTNKSRMSMVWFA